MEVSNSLILGIYALGVAILILLSIFVVYNFYKYRFKNDRTPLFVAIFITAFLATIIATLLMLRPFDTTAEATFSYRKTTSHA